MKMSEIEVGTRYVIGDMSGICVSPSQLCNVDNMGSGDCRWCKRYIGTITEKGVPVPGVKTLGVEFSLKDLDLTDPEQRRYNPFIREVYNHGEPEDTKFVLRVTPAFVRQTEKSWLEHCEAQKKRNEERDRRLEVQAATRNRLIKRLEDLGYTPRGSGYINFEVIREEITLPIADVQNILDKLEEYEGIKAVYPT